MKHSIKKVLLGISVVIFTAVSLTSCNNNNSTGWEFAPNMYNSRAYEPLSQVDFLKNPHNKDGKNMREPVAGTISRRNYKTTFGTDSSKVTDLMIYNIGKDSLAYAAAALKNPIPWSDDVEAQGKTLYERNCQHCHGEGGKGDGAVAKMYKGVPIYSSDALKNVSGGHIFHVITHGKGRMWSHASQTTPEERWKIVYYVQRLQNQ